jgi:hypothetical protein
MNKTLSKVGEIFTSSENHAQEKLAETNDDVEIFDMAGDGGNKDGKAQGFSSSVVASVSRAFVSPFSSRLETRLTLLHLAP